MLQIEIDVPADPHGQSTGTVKLTAPCVTVSSSAHGQLYEPTSGAFTGTVSAADPVTRQEGVVGTATALLSETAPDATGESTVSGDLTVQFSGCAAHVSVNEVRIGSSAQIGNGVLGVPLVPPFALVVDDPYGTRLNGTISGLGQDCKPFAVAPASATNNLLLVMTKQ